MADFSTAIEKTLKREGGDTYTEIAGDNGGATKFGISQAAYPKLVIRNLTQQGAEEIYKRDYWDRVRGDEIALQSVAENIFDTAVNMGVRTASKLTQLCLDMDPVTGNIGPETVTKINATDEHLFLCSFTISKIARYANICNQDRKQSKFLLGWINRALGAA